MRPHTLTWLRGALAALAFLAAAGCKTVPQGTLVEAIDFKQELSPHGEWIVVSPYGRLWHPST
ncbi:MAG: hypothetical protein ACYC8T_14550, partial [Myxococcaceae bacterium]